MQTRRGIRSATTTIYYALERYQISRWHVVDTDEIWHFYEGAPLELLAYHPKARALIRCVLGDTSESHERVAVIRKGVWQAARSLGDFPLVGCRVDRASSLMVFGSLRSFSGTKHISTAN